VSSPVPNEHLNTGNQTDHKAKPADYIQQSIYLMPYQYIGGTSDDRIELKINLTQLGQT
jgi:hypothetical protein